MSRSHFVRLSILVVVAAVPVARTYSQTGDSVMPRRDVFGSVIPTASTPLEKLLVCPFVIAKREIRRCAHVDSTGNYQLDINETTPVILSVHCQAIRGFAKLLAADTISIEGSRPLEKNYKVIPNGCDPRPIRKIIGVFRGHFVGGFEESSFIPCRSDSWVLPSDSLLADDSSFVAWVEFPKEVVDRIRWPRKAPHNNWGSARYYVRWKGSIIGPSSYGHMGVSPFLFRVEEVIEIRAAASRDCR
jgi:hypothetical protein